VKKCCGFFLYFERARDEEYAFKLPANSAG